MTTTLSKQISLSPMQLEAVQSIKEWYTNKNSKQSYFLAGYAGTGKSTLVDYVIKELDIKLNFVAFACYTGKAALVLTQKANGRFKARTIHRLIYNIDTDPKGGTRFVKKNKDELAYLKMIVIDECSMVDGQIMQDLKSFGIKILFIGDQGQLPPVSQKGNEEFVEMFNNPDFALTEIHRQAADNPIIHLSMLARTNQPIPYGYYGKNNEALVISRDQWEKVKHECYTTADQIICGYNRTRQQVNRDVRRFIGFTSELPQKGDKLICLKNDWNKNIQDINLVNGMTGYVEDVIHDVPATADMTRDMVDVNFRPDFTTEEFKNLHLVKDHFSGKEYSLLPHEYGIYNEFDFGYCITAHKSQGSQWEKVVVISEVLNRENHSKWLYTSITRSSSKLILVI